MTDWFKCPACESTSGYHDMRLRITTTGVVDAQVLYKCACGHEGKSSHPDLRTLRIANLALDDSSEGSVS